jgi:hypothetical protein
LINECVIRADRRHEYNFRSFKLKRTQVLKRECGCENVHTIVVKMIIRYSNKRCILDFIYKYSVVKSYIEYSNVCIWVLNVISIKRLIFSTWDSGVGHTDCVHKLCVLVHGECVELYHRLSFSLHKIVPTTNATGWAVIWSTDVVLVYCTVPPSALYWWD